MMVATDKGALRRAQISKKCVTGARAPLIDSGGFDCVTSDGDSGPDGRSNGTNGCEAGSEHFLASSVMSPS